MTEELISFKTAKLAKEKGFLGIKSQCHNWYYYDGTLAENKNIAGYKGLVCWNNWEATQGVRIDAPTQSLLQKWLREKHEIIVVIDNWYNQPVDGKIYKFCFQPVINCENQINTLCKTYEEALEKGLQEALKLV